MNTMDVALICKALGDSNRLQIVQMLSEGEKCGCKLLEAFKINSLLKGYPALMVKGAVVIHDLGVYSESDIGNEVA